MARKKTAIAKDPNHAVDAVRCLLPCQVRRGHPDVVNAYTDCYHSLQMEGLIPPTYRPLSARNLMGFLYRLSGNQLRNQSPWTLTALLDRYQTLGIHCRTTLTLRAHAHWITTLLQCPGFAQGPPTTSGGWMWVLAPDPGTTPMHRPFARWHDCVPC